MTDIGAGNYTETLAIDKHVLFFTYFQLLLSLTNIYWAKNVWVFQIDLN